MSVRDIDNDPDKAFGIGLPLNYDPNRDNGFFQQNYSYYRQIQDNIRNLLSTRIGERPGRPEFGSKLFEVIFEQNDAAILKPRVEEVIREALDTFLPFVSLVDTKLVANGNTLNVVAKFDTDFTDEVIEQVLAFDNGASESGEGSSGGESGGGY